jgi:putative oxidoreductase
MWCFKTLKRLNFEAGDNGFEIPIHYIIMLFTLMVYGSGKFNVDFFVKRATLA